MQTKLQKWGNSHAIRLPKTLLETANFQEDQTVKIFVENEQIIIQKIKKHKTMAERLKNFEGEYEFKEWDTGKPVGNEVL